MQPFVHAFVSCCVAEGQALRFMASLTEMFAQPASLPPPPACTAKSTPKEDRGFFGAPSHRVQSCKKGVDRFPLSCVHLRALCLCGDEVSAPLHTVTSAQT